MLSDLGVSTFAFLGYKIPLPNQALSMHCWISHTRPNVCVRAASITNRT